MADSLWTTLKKAATGKRNETQAETFTRKENEAPAPVDKASAAKAAEDAARMERLRKAGKVDADGNPVFRKGGKIDGIAQRGKTKGRYI